MFYDYAYTTPNKHPKLHSSLQHLSDDHGQMGGVGLLCYDASDAPLSAVCHTGPCAAPLVGAQLDAVQARWDDTVAVLAAGSLGGPADPTLAGAYRDAKVSRRRLARRGVNTAGTLPTPDIPALAQAFYAAECVRLGAKDEPVDTDMLAGCDADLAERADATGETATVHTSWSRRWFDTPADLCRVELYANGHWSKPNAHVVPTEALLLTANGIHPLAPAAVVPLSLALAIAPFTWSGPKAMTVEFHGPFGQALQSLCRDGERWVHEPLSPEATDEVDVLSIWDAAAAVTR